MKRWLTAIALAACCMLSLAGCDGANEPGNGVGGGPTDTPTADVVIAVGEVQEGARVSDIPVGVTIFGEIVDCRPDWVCFESDGYYSLDPESTIPADYFGRLDVYYNIPEGSLLDNLTVEIEAPGGTYDGTGDIGITDDGLVIAWSHILYGSLPETPEADEPAAETGKPAATAPAHKHNWAVDSSRSAANGCTYDGYKFMYCTGCSETYQETVSTKGHAYSSTITKAATCTDGGVERFSCANCGTVYEEYIYEKGHNWSSWREISKTHHERTCSACGASETAKCTFKNISCTVCGQVVIN